MSLRSTLLAAQVAISFVLLVSAGLLVRSVENARAHDPGFAVDGITAASLDLPSGAYTPARTRALVDQVLGAVDSAAASTREPLHGGRRATSVEVAGAVRMIEFQEVTPAYLEVLRIPVLAGRRFERADADRKVAMVNERMAERFGIGVGSVISVGKDKYEVVGIAKDAYLSELDRIDEMLYFPFTGKYSARFLIRGPAAHAFAAVVARLEPRAQVTLRPLSENVERWLRPARLASTVAGGMGALALALASVGMFGVFAYSVRRRTREIGMRMALGATRTSVVLEVLLGSSRAIAVGLAIGFAGALAASALIESGLYGIARLDPATYAAALALTGLGALAASAWPARAIARVDPMTALRCE